MSTLVAEQPWQRQHIEVGDELLTTREAAAALKCHIASFWRLKRKHPDHFPRPFYSTSRPTWSRAELMKFTAWLRDLRAAGATEATDRQ